MQPDNIHAAGMVLLLLATFGIISIFPRRPLNGISWRRLIIAIPVGVVTFFALRSGMVVHFKSQASSDPASQTLLASLCLMMVILFVKNKMIVIASCAVILATGYQLCSQYQYLVTKNGMYAYSDPLSGEFFNYASPDSWAKGIRAKRLWHTSFTGIFKAEGAISN